MRRGAGGGGEKWRRGAGSEEQGEQFAATAHTMSPPCLWAMWRLLLQLHFTLVRGKEIDGERQTDREGRRWRERQKQILEERPQWRYKQWASDKTRLKEQTRRDVPGSKFKVIFYEYSAVSIDKLNSMKIQKCLAVRLTIVQTWKSVICFPKFRNFLGTTYSPIILDLKG